MSHSKSIRPLLPALLCTLLLASDLSADDNWPQFRGGSAAGIGSGSPPIDWNVETGENIQWKTDLAGLSHSSPIIWGERIYVVTAVNAATDSPALGTGWLGGTGRAAEDTGVWSWQSFVTILRLADGTEVRRIPRNDVATWSTPLVIQVEEQTHIICNGYREMAAYDLATGEQLWYLSGGGDIPVPSPLFSHGLVLLTNGHGRSPSYAISPTARGDLSPPPVSEVDARSADTDSGGAPAVASQLPAGLVWYQPRDGSYIPTSIVIGDYMYTCNDNGRLSVRDVRNGSLVYQQRVGDGVTYSASAVGTDTHLYFSDEAGMVHVIKTGPEFELLAENDMRDTVMATPAISGNRLLIRTVKQLVCIGL